MSTESMFQLDVMQKIKLVTNFNTTKTIQASLNNATKFGYESLEYTILIQCY